MFKDLHHLKNFTKHPLSPGHHLLGGPGRFGGGPLMFCIGGRDPGGPFGGPPVPGGPPPILGGIPPMGIPPGGRAPGGIGGNCMPGGGPMPGGGIMPGGGAIPGGIIPGGGTTMGGAGVLEPCDPPPLYAAVV